MSTPTHGVQHKIAVKNASDVDVNDAFDAQEFDVGLDREQEESYKLGDPDPQYIVSGKKTVTGEFSREWVSGDPGALGERFDEAVDSGTEMWIGHYPEGDASPEIKVNNAKAESWRLRGGLDGTVKETVRYKGKTLAVSVS